MWREKWTLRKLGLYTSKFASAIVLDLNSSQLSQTQVELPLWLTLLSQCTEHFSESKAYWWGSRTLSEHFTVMLSEYFKAWKSGAGTTSGRRWWHFSIKWLWKPLQRVARQLTFVEFMDIYDPTGTSQQGKDANGTDDTNLMLKPWELCLQDITYLRSQD